MTTAHDLPPTLADVEALALAAIALLPPAFAPAAAEVMLRVEDFPLEDMCDEQIGRASCRERVSLVV